ncbi:hypothetical protein [Labilibaculum euxinus]
MKIRNLLVNITLLYGLSVSCSDGDNEPYGPEYEVDGVELSLRNDYYYRDKGDTISADKFVIMMKLKSDNEYAQDYGLNPQMVSEITDIKVSVLSDGLYAGIAKNDDVSRFFLMDDGEHYYTEDLYQTIAQYVEAGVTKSSEPYLYFTNQTELAPKAVALISDTITLAFKVDLTLKNNKTFNDQLRVTLIP